MADITWYGKLLQVNQSQCGLFYWNPVKKIVSKRTYHGHPLAILTKLDNEFGWEVIGVTTSRDVSLVVYHLKNSCIYDKEEWYE